MLVYHFEGVPRNPLVVALKNVLTFGFYTKVWLYRVNREMDGREGFHINFITLTVMLWLPIVTPAIVKFQTAARLNQMVSDPVTIPLIRARTLGWISLVPVLGAGFYAHWVQSSLNKFWFWNRRKERFQLNVERIKKIAKDPETEENLERRFNLEEECRRIEREMEEEIEAVRLRWGEQRFVERKKRADLHAKQGRLSRKEVQELRRKRKEERKAQRQRRRRERSVLARHLPRRADPEQDDLWEPVTPRPERVPEEIEEAAKAEGREISRKEARELQRAKRLLEAREKERARLEKRRAKLGARLRKKQERLQGRAGKKREALERKEAKGKKPKKSKGERKKEKRRKGRRMDSAGDAPVPEPEGPPKRRFVFMPPRRDPEEDAHWRPRTPEPEVDPDEILEGAEQEGREPSKKERKRAKHAEARLDKREKEEERLAAAREKARVKVQKRQEAERAKAERTEKREGEKKRKREKKTEKGKKQKDKGRSRRGDKPGKEDASKAKKRRAFAKKPKSSKKPEKEEQSTPSPSGSTGEAGLKVLKVRCPQCRTWVPVKKPDDRPARLTCPSCGLDGKVD